MTDEELEAVEPERSRPIEMTDFVDLAEIDPVFYRTTYYLAPEGEAAAKAYGLLRKAMGESSKVGIATLVMRSKEYLVAIRPEDDVLVLETMFFADEVPAPERESASCRRGRPSPPRDRDGRAADRLDGSDWDPERYKDTYRQQVEALIDQKRQGGDRDRGPHPSRPRWST